MPPTLTSLPPELRLQIYTHLLILPHAQKIHPSILLTSHAIHAEALPLLYSKNTFQAHHSLLTSFPRLRPSYPPVREQLPISLIKRVRLVIRLDCDARFTRGAATKMLSGLEELVVEVVQAVFLAGGHENLRSLEGVRGVRRVVIGGSVMGFEGYVCWLRRRMESEGDDGVGVVDGMDMALTG